MSKIPTKTNNKMTMSHHNVLNKTWNQQIYQQQKKSKKWAHLEILFGWVWSWEFRSWRSPSSSFHSRDGWYFFPLKVRKVGPWEDAMEMQRWRFENGFQKKKKGFCKDDQELKDLKKIFWGMEEIEFGSLEKWFSKQEMVWKWRKKEEACE